MLQAGVQPIRHLAKVALQKSFITATTGTGDGWLEKTAPSSRWGFKWPPRAGPMPLARETARTEALVSGHLTKSAVASY